MAYSPVGYTGGPTGTPFAFNPGTAIYAGDVNHGVAAPAPLPLIGSRRIPAPVYSTVSTPFASPLVHGGVSGLGRGMDPFSPPKAPSHPSRPAFNLETDPGVIAARAAAAQRRAMYQAQMSRQKRNAIIRSGDVNLAKAQGLGAADIAAAQANYDAGNADLSRVDLQNKLAHQAIVNQLAGRGILFSGETGYQEQMQGRSYGNQVYDLRQNTLDYLQQLADQYEQEVQAENEMVNQALAAATEYQMQQQAAWDAYYGGQG